MKYAKIVGNIVKQVQPNGQEGFIEVPDNVICGMTEEDGSFILPEIIQTADDIKKVRNQVRETGFEYNEFNIKADKESQNDLTSIVVSFNSGLLPDDTVIPWKVSTGTYLELNGKSEVLALSAVMTRFVQKVFSNEAIITSELESDNNIDISSRFAELME